jgi:hypothetical protein
MYGIIAGKHVIGGRKESLKWSHVSGVVSIPTSSQQK